MRQETLVENGEAAREAVKARPERVRARRVERTAEIRGASGDVVFRQEGCLFPEDWDQLAVDVVASKYFFGPVSGGNGDPADGAREFDLGQLVSRVVSTIADWGLEDGYFREPGDVGDEVAAGRSLAFLDRLTRLVVDQKAAFNSPVWFNVGLSRAYGLKGPRNNFRWDRERGEAVPCEDAYLWPQASACFIQSVTDDMDGIMRLATSEAVLFKFGSGTGTDLTPLRSSRERLSGGGRPSGPVSFMKIYDAVAGVVKSGGKTRRAAKIQTLKCHHPDIVEFIECKALEDRKAKALIAAGHSDSFDDGAYASVRFQNANLSVRCADAFLRAAEKGGAWVTRAVTTGMPVEELNASDVLDRMAAAAWECGDPGVQYEDTVQEWHTCPNTAPINSSNPCGEYVFIDNSACNLASINLLRFLGDDGRFDVEGFCEAVDDLILAQDVLVDRASYPTPEIAENSHRFRPLGLGLANLGALLMAIGAPYDSDEGRAWAGLLTAVLTGRAYLASAKLADRLGAFDGHALNAAPMAAVIRRHRDHVSRISGGPAYLRKTASLLWESCVLSAGADGFRNSQVTLCAPTGTIAFMMGCDTTGIEPDIALVKYKRLAGGGSMRIVNRTVGRALRRLGYGEEAVAAIVRHVEEHGSVEGAGLPEDHVAVFDCAFPAPGRTRCVSVQGHVRMMAAIQPMLSGAISKTVNMPASATPREIRDAYLEGWKLGLKSLTIYRDGSKLVQPVSTSAPGSAAAGASKAGGPVRERLPATRAATTHKFDIQGSEGYLTIGFYDDGRPGEVFIQMAKEGSTVGGLMDVFGTAISIGLQYGVPLDVFVNKFAHTRFEPAGFTGDPDVPIAKSPADYVFRWMGARFLAKADDAAPAAAEGPVALGERAAPLAWYQSDAPGCPSCGAITVRNGSCYRCLNCGESLGCS